MIRNLSCIGVVLLVLLVGGCASGPEFDAAQYDRTVTPNQVASDLASHDNRAVLWGGLIVGISNLENTTEIEILAYPLGRDLGPDEAKNPSGRFIARRDEFVEPLEFAPGQQITVAGSVVEAVDGKIGQADYRYPVVDADDLFLWSSRRARVRPEVGFGFGFIFGS